MYIKIWHNTTEPWCTRARGLGIDERNGPSDLSVSLIVSDGPQIR